MDSSRGAPWWLLAILAASCRCGGQTIANAPVDVGDAGDATTTDAADARPPVSDEAITTFHHHASRDGAYVQPSLTRAVAATLVRDTAFDGTVTGQVRAQPLYVPAPPAGGAGIFVVATGTNDVFALDETTGKQVWKQSLGPAPIATGSGCGNVSPVGDTSTPVVDLARNVVFLVGALGTGTGAGSSVQTYRAHALSLVDGSELSGWPIDIGAVSSNGHTMAPKLQNQRGALLLANGTLYVPFGGNDGDCGAYQGWVVAIDVDARKVTAFATIADGGGIWAVGGPASDGTDVFFTTGNTKGATTWGDGEAVIRDPIGPLSDTPAEAWAPSNWKALDNGDVDIGGTGAMTIDVAGSTPSKLVVAMGKDGGIYLLDRGHLAGVGAPPLARLQVGGSGAELSNAPAAYATSQGTFLAFRRHESGSLVGCTNGVTNADLGAVRVVPGAPPTLAMAWCAVSQGRGSPMVTMTDASGSDAIVWAEGAEQSEKLFGWDGLTGALVYAGGGATEQLGHTQHFTTPIAARGRVLVGSDGKLSAFRAP